MTDRLVHPAKYPENAMSTLTLECLTTDLAYNIHEAPTIAARYGFENWEHLKDFLIANPWICEDARQLRIVHESDIRIANRVNQKSLFGVESVIHHLVAIVKNPYSDAKDKISAFKELRQAGGVGSVTKEGGPGAAQFNLVINMPGGAERLTTTVVNPPPVIDVEDDE